MSAFAKIWAAMKTFGKCAQKNPTLTAGFGGTGVLIANERCGRWDVKTDIKTELHRELAAFRTYVDGKFTAVDDKLVDLHTELEFTQGLVLRSAIKTMKAVDDNKKELREFVKDAEKPLSCIELGEDCREVIDDGVGFKPVDGSKEPVEK